MSHNNQTFAQLPQRYCLPTRKCPTALLFVLALLCLLLVITSTTYAAALEAKDEQKDKVHTMSRHDLESYMDGVIQSILKKNRIPGATISVVKEGKLLFTKGYGWANVESKIPVDPYRTLFRIASISKIFTATAVMQQVELGNINLDADVNDYLVNFKVPDTYVEPVRIRDLLAHTAGFEESGPGQFLLDSMEGFGSLAEVLARDLPARVRAPGTYTSYSNHGTALLGRVVELVSGMSFADYVERRILSPLSLHYTTVRQPVPQRLQPYLSIGYTWKNDEFQAGPFEFSPIPPAVAFSASAADMATFMLAHLQLGRYEGVRILEAPTAKLMQSRLFGHDDRVSGMAHQFYEVRRSGEHIIGHDGSVNRHYSNMLLLPSRQIGFFVSFNGGIGEAPGIVGDLFLDRYFPTQQSPLQVQESQDFEATQKVMRLAGFYRGTRSGYTNVTKIVGLFGWRMEQVTVDPRGRIHAFGKIWVESEPLVFHQIDGDNQLVFSTDESDTPTHLFHSNLPTMGYEKLAWFQSPHLHIAIALATLVILLPALIYWPFTMIKSRKQPEPNIRAARFAHMVGWISAFICFYFIFALVSSFEQFTTGRVPMQIYFALYLNYLLIPLAVAAVFYAVQAWRKRFWPHTSSAYYTLVALAVVSAAWWADYWNVMGVRW